MPGVVRFRHISRVAQEKREMAAVGLERNKLRNRVVRIVVDKSPLHQPLEKKLLRPLRSICHRHSAAGEPVGTGRPYLRWILVGECLSPTPERAAGESAGVTGAPQR